MRPTSARNSSSSTTRSRISVDTEGSDAHPSSCGSCRSDRSVELIAQGPAPGAAPPEPQIVWSPKAAAPPDWTAPNRPHKKLSELLAKHKGQSEWTETMVDDDTLHADYVAMVPGGKTPRRMNTDTREWWAVQDGQIRTEGGNKPYVDFNAECVPGFCRCR